MRNIILLACLLLISCSNEKEDEWPVPGVNPDVVATPAPLPDPSGPVSWWRPGPIPCFQIMHFSSPADLKKVMKKGCAVITLELDQVREYPGTQIADIVHANGSKLICYSSEGYQKSHSDEAEFPRDAMGDGICRAYAFKKCISYWPGEKWGNPTKASWLKFQSKRLDVSKELGCDGYEPDNMDQDSNDVGFKITKEQNIAAQIALVQAAHSRGLAIFQKNGLNMTKELAPHFDGIYNEQCLEYDECEHLAPYKDKLIAIMSYGPKCKKIPEAPSAACKNSDEGYFENED